MNNFTFSLWGKTPAIALIGAMAFLTLTCANPSEEGGGDKDPTTNVTVTEVTKEAATDVRDSYGLFEISANADVANFYLAVKETGEAAPTVAEMTNHGLKRDLSSTPINVLIAQRMNAPMITFAKAYFDNPDHKTLGNGMSEDRYDTNYEPGVDTNMISGVVSDGADVSGTWTKATQPWVEDSILRPETDYTLYGMVNNTVKNLLAFSTDPSPTSWKTTDADIARVDTTLATNSLTLTLNSDEYYIIPIQARSPDGKIPEYHNLFFSQQVSGDNVADFTLSESSESSEPRFYAVPDYGYRYQLELFPYQDSLQKTIHSSFVLIDTARIVLNNNSDLFWGVSFRLNDGQPTNVHKLKFTIQN